jgi:hypothetical protein
LRPAAVHERRYAKDLESPKRAAEAGQQAPLVMRLEIHLCRRIGLNHTKRLETIRDLQEEQVAALTFPVTPSFMRGRLR